MCQHLKYKLVYAAALCVAVALCPSCSSEPEPASSAAMEFAVGDVSRASLTDASNIAEASFAVFGDMHLTSSSLLTVTHNGTIVTYAGGSWNYSDTQYWMPQHEHSFVAIHPASDLAGADDITYTDSRLSFTYTSPEDVRQANDLLAATHRRVYNLNTDRSVFPVQFRFHHILSRLEPVVTVKDPDGDKCYLVITDILLKDITTSATYTISPAPLADNSEMTDDGSDEGWSATASSDRRISFPETGENLLNRVPADAKPHHILAENEAILLLPKSTPTEIEISYKKYDSSTNDVIDEQTVRQTIPVGWKAGKSYVLSLTMTRGMVQFSIEVAEWTDGDTTGATVPRK